MNKKISIEKAVKIINSIKDRYPKLRQDSKKISFAAQYGGTYHTFMDSGFSEDEAKQIEANYNTLYKASLDWKNNKLHQATKDGYVPLAFGGKLRTPILKQTLLNTKVTPYEAEAEGRTAGNALGQSYGTLNNRAANEFMDLVYKSEYRNSIIPIAQIHDAQYYLAKRNIDCIKFINDNLIKAMQWQELPEIQHDTVKLGAELDVFHRGWHEPITVPNNCSREELIDILLTQTRKYNENNK